MNEDILQAIKAITKQLDELEQRLTELENNFDKHFQDIEAHKN